MSDEGYYAALAYKFALGLRPLADELVAHQFAAFLISPIVAAWMRATGGTQGLVLALRVSYLSMSLMAGVLSFLFLRKVMDWRIALVSVACAVAIIPFQIPALSYDTLPMLFISAAVSCACIAQLDRPRNQWLFAISGLLFGLAAVSYPTLAALLIIVIGIVWWETKSFTAAALLALGAAVATAAFLLAISRDLASVPDFLAYNRFMAQQLSWLAGPAKVVAIGINAVSNTYRNPTAWILIAIVVTRYMRRPVPPLLTVLLPISTVLLLHIAHHGLTYEYTMIIAFTILIAAWISAAPRAQRNDRSRPLVLALTVGFIMAFIMAYTSNIAFLAAGYGALAVAAPAMAMLISDARDAMEDRLGAPRALLAAVLMGAVVAAGIIVTDFRTVYRDEAPPYLHTLASGPYAGILTTESSASWIRQAQADLSATTGPADRIFLYGAPPAMYLMSRARPVAPSLWMGSEGAFPDAAKLILMWINGQGHQPTAVVLRGSESERDPVVAYFVQHYRPVVRRADYVILRLR